MTILLPRLPRGSAHQLVVALALFCVLAFSILGIWSLYHERHERMAHARAETANLARVLEEHASRMLQNIDLIINDIAGHLTPADFTPRQDESSVKKARTEALNALLREKITHLGENEMVHVANAAGHYLYSSLPAVPKVTIGDREYFLESMQDRHAGLVISKPLLSRAVGTWVVTVSRRISFGDGEFSGVVNVVVPLSSLERFYASLNLGTHGVVLMRDREMRLLARSSALPALMGEAVPGHPLLHAALDQVRSGSYEEQSPADAVRRLYSYRQVGDYPLYVLAGVAVDDILAAWRVHAWGFGLAWLLLVSVVGVLALIVRRVMILEKCAKEELAQVNQRLEQQVEERTRQLERANDAAEAGRRAKSAFLANMSHELRTPLNAILGFSQLLLRTGGLNDEANLQVERIDRAGRHLLSLVDSILNVSRIESRREPSVCEPFDLAQMLERAILLARPDAESKGIGISLEGDEALPGCVEGDEARIYQILVNLLSNAIKFTVCGRVVLRVTRSGGEYRFEVIDSGPGIARAERERVFPAASGGGLVDADFEESGLGLAVSRDYARRLGGDIELTSEVGKGSTFTLCVRLPECENARDTSTLGLDGAVRAAALADLPAELRGRLCAAAEALEVGAARAVIDEIRRTDPALARGLETLAQCFRFDEIVRHCREID